MNFSLFHFAVVRTEKVSVGISIQDSHFVLGVFFYSLNWKRSTKETAPDRQFSDPLF